MSQAESSSLAKIPTKNRLDVFQSQESCPPQLQEPTQAIPAKIPTNQNTILECIKKKRKNFQTKQASTLRHWSVYHTTGIKQKKYGETSPPHSPESRKRRMCNLSNRIRQKAHPQRQRCRGDRLIMDCPSGTP
jgi:hypothetical protein